MQITAPFNARYLINGIPNAIKNITYPNFDIKIYFDFSLTLNNVPNVLVKILIACTIAKIGTKYAYRLYKSLP